MSKVFADKNKEFEQFANDWLYEFGKANRSWLWDEYLERNSFSAKALSKGVIGTIEGVRFVESIKVKPDEIKVSGKLSPTPTPDELGGKDVLTDGGKHE